MTEFEVQLGVRARDDLDRLYEFQALRDIESAERALLAIEQGLKSLRYSPFTCRKAGESPFLRELVISYGRTGYVALFEIDARCVTILAVRHQRESDYH